MIDKNGYRLNVGVVLCNSEGQLLWAKRIGTKNAWQFPQGGVHDGETLEETLYRELDEELGLSSTAVQVMAKTSDWLFYDLPKKFRRYNAKPLCVGQKQHWFLLKLVGDDQQISLNKSAMPEFDDWRWVDYWYPVDHVIAFKRHVYHQVLKEFESVVKAIS